MCWRSHSRRPFSCAAGASKEDINGASELLKTLLPIIVNEKESKVIDEELRAAVDAWMKTQPEATVQGDDGSGISPPRWSGGSARHGSATSSRSTRARSWRG